jgi:hypothetical protein
MPDPLKFNVSFEKPLSFPDFDKRVLKKGFRKVGAEVTKLSRKLVSRKGLSKPYANPGMHTGHLRQSISAKVSKSGFSVGVANYSTKALKEFYPAYVYYGHVGPKKALRTRTGKRRHEANRSGKKVALPRNNYIIDAALRYGETKYQSVLRKVLADAIKPGVIGGAFK